MQNSDLYILQQGLEWLSQGHAIKLVTIVTTIGATPGPVGSIAIFSNHGHIAGSVSGGCIEEELLESLPNSCTNAPQLIDYSLPQQSTVSRGLPCGGKMQLLVSSLNSIDALTEWVEALQQRKLILYRLDLITEKSQIEVISKVQPFEFHPKKSISRCFGPGWRMLIIGANEVARQLAQIALTLDYEIEVCDPRIQYQNAWGLPDIKLEQQMPDEFIQYSKPDNRTVVITLAHDPRIDDLALIEALKSDCFYVGALGSLQTSQQRKKRLTEFLTDDELQRLHGPVGLAIGSRTPAEIGISILAEITALRNNRSNQL